MAKADPGLGETLLAVRDWARGEAAPYLTWLPNWIEPYAVDTGAALVLFAAVIAAWRFGAELWGAAIWAPRGVWRWATGIQAPKSETEEIRDDVKKIRDDIEALVRAQIEAQVQDSRGEGEELAIDVVERAVAAAREVLLSNDPSKAEAQKALRDGDMKAAEDALERAFAQEADAALRVNDEAQQLNAKAARTAREKAALAATRSVADAIHWYGKAAEFEPADFWTHIELARLHIAKGDLSSALRTGEAGRDAARDDRDGAVVSDQIGDVQVKQGNLTDALASYQASIDIRERLAAADPGNAGWQRDLSVSHNKIGDVQVQQGNLTDALASYQADLDIAQRLAAADPGNAGWQRDLSVSHNKIGDVQVQQGNLESDPISLDTELA